MSSLTELLKVHRVHKAHKAYKKTGSCRGNRNNNVLRTLLLIGMLVTAPMVFILPGKVLAYGKSTTSITLKSTVTRTTCDITVNGSSEGVGTQVITVPPMDIEILKYGVENSMYEPIISEGDIELGLGIHCTAPLIGGLLVNISSSQQRTGAYTNYSFIETRRPDGRRGPPLAFIFFKSNHIAQNIFIPYYAFADINRRGTGSIATHEFSLESSDLHAGYNWSIPISLVAYFDPYDFRDDYSYVDEILSPGTWEGDLNVSISYP